MKFGFNLKSLAWLFVIVLAAYIAGFYGIEHLRHRRGPWVVTFITDTNGQPAIVIDQPALNIAEVTIHFLGEHAASAGLRRTVRFSAPLTPVPFGKVINEDLRFLPGVVTFDLFGHEIELRPPVLSVNRREIPWKRNRMIKLTAADKPAEPLGSTDNSGGH